MAMLVFEIPGSAPARVDLGTAGLPWKTPPRKNVGEKLTLAASAEMELSAGETLASLVGIVNL